MENRIHAISLIHQKLYQSKNLSSINLKEDISELAELLFANYKISTGTVTLNKNLSDVSVLIDTAIPCGLILNELISNSLKYAFPNNKKGEIKIKLAKIKDEIEIIVSDNGIGFSENFDIKTSLKMGIQTIIAIGKHQLQGKVVFETKKGVSCKLKFKETKFDTKI